MIAPIMAADGCSSFHFFKFSNIHLVLVLYIVLGVLQCARGVLEQNPSVSLRKFIKFNLPEILKKVMEEL